tara:strand:- start:93 stop:290 length:198 start_codon:yes stop_codon:yes gene_type:complete
MTRPAFVLDVHLQFLDNLRELGTVNMFGAAEDFASFFGLELETASEILAYWMATFKDRASTIQTS